MQKIKKLIRKLYEPMPLDNNFKDYDEYWHDRGFHAPSQSRAKLLSQRIEAGATILDIGCGDGTVIAYLAKHNKPKNIVGIDISKRAVKHVKANGFTAYEYDVLSKEFAAYLKGKKFDYVIITEVLEHVQDPETLIVLVRKHINKAVFASIPNTGFIVHRIRLMFGRFPLVSLHQHVKEHIRFWTKKDFIYWANYHGYNVDNVIVASWKQNLFAKLAGYAPGLLANQIMYKISKK